MNAGLCCAHGLSLILQSGPVMGMHAHTHAGTGHAHGHRTCTRARERHTGTGHAHGHGTCTRARVTVACCSGVFVAKSWPQPQLAGCREIPPAVTWTCTESSRYRHKSTCFFFSPQISKRNGTLFPLYYMFEMKKQSRTFVKIFNAATNHLNESRLSKRCVLGKVICLFMRRDVNVSLET